MASWLGGMPLRSASDLDRLAVVADRFQPSAIARFCFSRLCQCNLASDRCLAHDRSEPQAG